MPNNDPFTQLANIVKNQAIGHAKNVLQGVPVTLGTMTATGVLLDDFKHEIKDPLYADWNVKIHFPAFSMMGTESCTPAAGPIGTGASVDAEGSLLPGAGTRGLTKWDFQEKEVDQVRLEIKPDLNAGDRVLVIPINGGQECVIVCKVVSGDA